MFKTSLDQDSSLQLESGHIDIVTDRLRLTPLRAEHGSQIVALLQDAQVTRGLARVPHPYTQEDFDGFLNQISQTDLPQLRLAITDWRDGAVIGVVGLRGINSLQDEGISPPELGYWLGRAYWGQGLMKEATAALLDHVFALSPYDVIHSGCFTDNDRSFSVLSHLGFVETGRSSVPCLARGGDVDHRDMELTRDRYFGTGAQDDGRWHQERNRTLSYTLNY